MACHALGLVLDRTDIAHLLAFRAGATLERDALIFTQALGSVCPDVLKVGEQIAVAIVRLNKAEALGIVEPFYCTGLLPHLLAFHRNENDRRNAQEAPDNEEGYRKKSNRNKPHTEQDGKRSSMTTHYTEESRKAIARL